MTNLLQALADEWRESLVTLGFSDDGDQLHGNVPWSPAPDAPLTRARVKITLGPMFPFAPPQVVLLDAGAPLELTFHLERNGTLCLWEDDWAVDEAPWREPRRFLRRIASWLESTAAGWPDDDSCDLERYLQQDPKTFVVYDATALLLDAPVRTSTTLSDVIVTNERRKIRELPGGRRRRDNRLAWVSDVGALDRPLRGWDDIAVVLGQHAPEVTRLITFGALTLLLLRYTRGGTPGALALKVHLSGPSIGVLACESADTSATTRGLRAGAMASRVRDVPIAVVGCGAIGSFAADLLFRSGARRLTLIDGERLRPGNIVRHLAGGHHIGRLKTEAVLTCLAEIDPDISQIQISPSPAGLAAAVELVRSHQVVLDATGSARASSLLAAAADHLGPGSGHTVVTVCAQREGGVVRVDRMPLRATETHLPPLAMLGDVPPLRERGCGTPVSPTPPGAVVAAAELAHRVVLDEATRACLLPATMTDVRHPQPEAPFDRPGLVTSADLPQAAAS